MPTAVIVDAVRTAAGRRNGQLKDWHPVDLAAEVLRTLVARNDLDPALVEDVNMGCVIQVGEPKLNDRYAPVGGLVPQGISAELIADKWNLSREELDAYSVQSHQRAARATEEGRFEKQIIPVTGADGGVFDRDEGVRPDSNVEKL